MANLTPFVLTLAALLALGGCQNPAGTTPVTISGGATPAPVPTTPAAPVNWVTKVQALYGLLRNDASLWVALHPADAAAVAKFEKILDPEVAALSSDVAPTSVSAVVQDIALQVQALPPGLVSPQVQIGLDVAAAAVLLAPSAQVLVQ